MVDAQVLGACGRKTVRVQVPSCVPKGIARRPFGLVPRHVAWQSKAMLENQL